ncbi:MAG TPA: TolC family protein [Gemmatimonadales bacterium]|nr:TolC family protein [Gemmatimonadales bacterium]
MRRLSLLLVMAGAGVAPLRAQQPDTAAVTLQVGLEEAVRRALDVQPAMVQAAGATRNAGAARRSAYGSFLPQLSLNGSASLNSTNRVDLNGGQIPPTWSYGSGLSASVDLFTGLRRIWTLRSASADLSAADAGMITQRYQTILQTKQAFYNAIATEELVSVADAQVRRAQLQLDVSVQKLHAGSATRSDSLRSAVDYGNARIALLEAQANLATAQASLGRQVGVDQPVRALPDSALPPVPDTTALRIMSSESAPQIAQADAQARAAQASAWATRSQYIPSLRLSYGLNRRDTLFSNVLVGNPTHNWQFSLSWTLFNGFTREQNQVSASVQRDNAEAQAADTRRMVNAQLTQQIAALETAYAQIDIASVNVAAATEDLRVQQERYRVGAGTILDLLTSQAALTQAQTNLVQVRFNYLIARAQLEALVGRSL